MIFLRTKLYARISGNSGDSPSSVFAVLGQIIHALVWKGRQNFTFKINFPAINAQPSTNKMITFKLIIEDYSNNHFESIGSKLLPLAQIKSVAFFSGTPGTSNQNSTHLRPAICCESNNTIFQHNSKHEDI